MKSLKNVAAIIACLAAITIFTACPNPDKEDPTIEYLSFRIEGLPVTNSSYQVWVFPNGTEITSPAKHSEAMNQCVAAGYVWSAYGYSCDLTVFPVGNPPYWKGNGSYVVLVIVDKNIVITDVTFNNGGATVKYSSFKPGYTI